MERCKLACGSAGRGVRLQRRSHDCWAVFHEFAVEYSDAITAEYSGRAVNGATAVRATCACTIADSEAGRKEDSRERSVDESAD